MWTQVNIPKGPVLHLTQKTGAGLSAEKNGCNHYGLPYEVRLSAVKSLSIEVVKRVAAKIYVKADLPCNSFCVCAGQCIRD